MKRGKIFWLAALVAFSPISQAGDVWKIGTNESKINPAPSGMAGPDGGGYYYIDSTKPGGPAYNYVTMTAADAVFTNSVVYYYSAGTLLDIGFSFPFYGANYTQLVVNDNGFLTFDLSNPASCCTDEGGDHMPSTSARWDEPKALIAGMWTTTYAPSASLYHKVIGTAPNRVAIIELRNWNYYSYDPNATSYQYHLHEDGTIEIHYQAVDITSNVGNVWYTEKAIGIEDMTQTKGLTYFLGYASDLATAGISSGRAVRFFKSGVSSSSYSITTTEAGGSETFGLRLSTMPTADVTVALSGDSSEGQLSVSDLTFTPANWDVPQSVTVTGVDDPYGDGNVTYPLTVTTSSADPLYNASLGLVTITNTDDELAGFTVTGVPVTTSEDGSSAQVTFTLNTEVAGTITVPVSVTDTSEASLSATQLVFDSSHLSQTITVTGLDDSIADGDVPYLLQLGSAVTNNTEDAGYTGMAFGSYNATNLNDDVAGFNVDTSMTGNTSERGRSTTFTMALTSEPIGDVTITFGVSDTAEATITPSITFTPANWMTLQTVTVTGLDDGVADGDKQYTITYHIVSADAGYSGRAIPELDELVLVNKENTDLQELQELTSNLTPPSSNSGGGALNPLLLLAMGGLFLVRRRKVN